MSDSGSGCIVFVSIGFISDVVGIMDKAADPGNEWA
jgi:hypothetical protein